MDGTCVEVSNKLWLITNSSNLCLGRVAQTSLLMFMLQQQQQQQQAGVTHWAVLGIVSSTLLHKFQVIICQLRGSTWFVKSENETNFHLPLSFIYFTVHHELYFNMSSLHVKVCYEERDWSVPYDSHDEEELKYHESRDDRWCCKCTDEKEAVGTSWHFFFFFFLPRACIHVSYLNKSRW